MSIEALPRYLQAPARFLSTAHAELRRNRTVRCQFDASAPGPSNNRSVPGEEGVQLVSARVIPGIACRLATYKASVRAGPGTRRWRWCKTPAPVRPPAGQPTQWAARRCALSYMLPTDKTTSSDPHQVERGATSGEARHALYADLKRKSVMPQDEPRTSRLRGVAHAHRHNERAACKAALSMDPLAAYGGGGRPRL